MNIRNFISNIFSSSKKDRKEELRRSAGKSKDDHFFVPSNNNVQQQPEEDLLSNLRRSKLFFDDMDIPKQSFQPISELPQQQLLIDLASMEESNHSILPASVSQTNESSKQLQTKKTGLIPVPVDQIHLTTPSKLEREELMRYNQRPNFSDFLNSLKKENKPADNSTSVKQNIINNYADRRNQFNIPSSSSADEPYISNAAAVVSQGSIITTTVHSNTAGRSNLRSFGEDNLMIPDNLDSSTAGIHGNDSVMMNVRNASSRVAGGFPVAQEIIQGGSAIMASSSLMMNNNNFTRSSSRSSSKSSSRVRGSSSKKKAMFVESPISNRNSSKRGEAMIAEIGSTMYPTLEPFCRETISTKYQNNTSMLVKEDVDGENEALAAAAAAAAASSSQAVISARPECSSALVVDEDFISQNGEDNLSEIASSGRPQDCLSTRAEPPTQAKNRSNSFYFEESPAEKPKNMSKIQRCSSVSNSSKGMSIESPGSSAGRGQAAPAVATDAVNISLEGVSVFNAAQRDSNSAKNLSDKKSKSNGSSPNRSSLNSFHKQIQMMVDKSEMPPNNYSVSKSAQKVPSPIKEVEEYSQRNIQRQSSKDMEVLDEPGKRIEGVDSPKLRQKSVKFNYEQTPCEHSSQSQHHPSHDKDDGDDDYEDNNEIHRHHSRVHDKLQSRKPTPYNPYKSQPLSYLSRQNNFQNDDENESKERNSPSNQQEFSGTILFKNNDNDDIEGDAPQIPQQQQDSEKRNNVFQKSAPHTQQQQLLNSVSQAKPKSPSRAVTTLKKPVKFPLALKKTDFIAQMNEVAAVDNRRKGLHFSHSNGFIKSEALTNIRTHAGLVNSHAKKDISLGRTAHTLNKANENNLSSTKMLNNNKKKIGSDDIAILNESHESSEIASNPLPRTMRGTMLSSAGGFNVKSAYKNCVFCQSEIKHKEEFKMLTCSHKSHIGCQPKDKNTRCPRCNSNNLSNKYRAKEQ